MVHQRMWPPAQTTGRGGLERCNNCGFGLGQFGVEFAGDYSSHFCSLDCYTSAKVTGKNVSRDSRFLRKYEPQAPWPQGLLVEAPPSPKPWRGRSWSHDICQTSVTTSLTREERSSQESLATWQGIGRGRLYNSMNMRMGIGAGMGMDLSALGGTETGGIRGASREVLDVNVANGARGRSNRAGSGGGRALGNSESGGTHVGDAGYDGKMGRRNTGIARTTSRPDASRREGAGTGRVVKGNTARGNDVVEHGLPPLAPVPRTGAFLQTRLVTGGVAGCRKVEMCAESFAGLPADNAPPKMEASAVARAPKPCDEKVAPSESISTCADNVDAQRSLNLPRSNVPRQSIAVAAAVGERRIDGERGPQITAAAVTSEAGRGEENVAIEHVYPIFAGDRGRVSRGVPESNLRYEEVVGHCGIEATPEMDAAATGRTVACDPVRAQPTKAAMRQWRHMFFP